MSKPRPTSTAKAGPETGEGGSGSWLLSQAVQEVKEAHRKTNEQGSRAPAKACGSAERHSHARNRSEEYGGGEEQMEQAIPQ